VVRVADVELVAVQILVPVLSDTTRQPWPQDVIDAWEADAVKLFGAFTRMGVVSGVWQDERGVVVADESRCYLIAVTRERLGEVRAFARAACHTFEQRCIYFQVVGSAELLYPEE
jgi:hypothetical protein